MAGNSQDPFQAISWYNESVLARVDGESMMKSDRSGNNLAHACQREENSMTKPFKSPIRPSVPRTACVVTHDGDT